MSQRIDARTLLRIALGNTAPMAVESGIVSFLSTEGLSGLALRNHPHPELWPEDSFTVLHRERVDLTALEALREHALSILSRACSSPPVVLKGFACGRTLYSAPEERPCGDVDVLLGPGGFDEAMLESAGFRELAIPGIPEPVGGWNTRTFKRGPVSLDLHFRVFRDPPYRFPTADLLARARPMESRPELLELDRLDAITFHIAHLGKHCFLGPLIRWVDLRRMLDRWIAPGGAESWGELVRRSRETRTMRVTRLAFAVLDSLGLPPPPIPSRAAVLRPRVIDRRLARRVLDPRSLPPHRPSLLHQALFRLALADDAREATASVLVAADWIRRRALQGKTSNRRARLGWSDQEGRREEETSARGA